MRNNYLKILFITIGVQIGSLLIGFIFYNLPVQSELLKNISLFLFVVNVPVSIILAIIFALKWGNTLKEKLVCIFLMPTNYTWIIYCLAVSNFVKGIIKMLIGIPENFG